MCLPHPLFIRLRKLRPETRAIAARREIAERRTRLFFGPHVVAERVESFRIVERHQRDELSVFVRARR